MDPLQGLKELPEMLPSALIRLALGDLEAVERSERYTVAMYERHQPHEHMDSCVVCLAGAVMANSLGASPNAALLPVYFEQRTSNYLQALNLFRVGDFVGGVQHMSNNGSWPDKVAAIDFVLIPPYGSNSVGFKVALLRNAQLLEEAGL